MANEPAIRADDPNITIPAVGSYVEISYPDLPDFLRMKVAQWELWHDYHNYEIYGSGGEGSAVNRRVADAYNIVIASDLDISLATPLLQSWLEGDGETNWRIGMHFHCGDPTFWSNPELHSIARIETDSRGIYYACVSAMVEQIYAIASPRENDVVRCIVKTRGSSPLQRRVNKAWQGEGAFGLGGGE